MKIWFRLWYHRLNEIEKKKRQTVCQRTHKPIVNVLDRTMLLQIDTIWFCCKSGAALRKFLPSFFETGLTFGRSLIAVFWDTSDGADRCVVDVGADIMVVEKSAVDDWLVAGDCIDGIDVVNRNALLSDALAPN